MQALPHSGFVWHELTTTDPDQAQRFYADVVGISVSLMGEGPAAYRLAMVDGTPAGGFVGPRPDGSAWPSGGPEPHWVASFGVRMPTRPRARHWSSAARSCCHPPTCQAWAVRPCFATRRVRSSECSPPGRRDERSHRAGRDPEPEDRPAPGEASGRDGCRAHMAIGVVARRRSRRGEPRSRRSRGPDAQAQAPRQGAAAEGGPFCPGDSDIYPGNWPERETMEMFRIDFDGHPLPVELLLSERFDPNELRKNFVAMSRRTKPCPRSVEVEEVEVEEEEEG